MSTANGKESWVRYLSGDTVTSGGDRKDSSTAVSLAPNGDVVIAGLSDGAIARSTFSSAENWFVTRYTSLGSFSWSYIVDYQGTHSSLDLAVSTDDKVYFQGYTDRGYSALFRLNGADGRFELNRDQNGYGARVATGPDGGLYFSGFSNYGFAPDLPYRSYFIGYYDKSDLRTEKWGVQVGNLADSTYPNLPLHDIAAITSTVSLNLADTLQDGAYVLTNNEFWDVVSPGSTPRGVVSPILGDSGNGNRDNLLIKVSPKGTVSWAQLFGTSDNDTPYAVAVDKDNNVYVSFGSSIPSGTLTTFLAQINGATGEVIWTQSLNIENVGEVQLAVGTDGYVYLSGLVRESNSSVLNNVFLLKVDPSSVKPADSVLSSQATKGYWTFGSTSANESFGGITAAKDGSIYITGSSNGSFGTSPTGSFNQNQGASDAFLMKFELPTVATNATKALLNLNQVNTINFSLSDAGEVLRLSDLVFVNGESVPGSFSGSGTNYTVKFKPNSALTENVTASVEVVSNKFQSLPTNKVSFEVDPVAPTLTLTSDKAALKAGETATLTLSVSEKVARDFNSAAVSVSGGSLSAWVGADTLYTAIFTPSPDAEIGGSITIGSEFLADSAANNNVDGSDANNTVTITVDTRTQANSSTTPSTPICFLKGTNVSLKAGVLPVEALSTSQVLASQDQLARIKWIGYQRRTPEFAQFDDYLPVKICAGALEENVPVRDLYLSPDHAVLVDGHLIHAQALVNGRTIIKMTEWEGDIEYYHIETENHEIIFAEGVPCETFIDNVSREQFDNYAEYQALYPYTQMMRELPLPRVKFRRQIPSAIWRRLMERADLITAAQDQA